MLDGLFGALNVGADIDMAIETPREPEKKTGDDEEVTRVEDNEEQKNQEGLDNLPKQVSPYKMYGSAFDDWVKQNRPDFKKPE